MTSFKIDGQRQHHPVWNRECSHAKLSKVHRPYPSNESRAVRKSCSLIEISKEPDKRYRFAPNLIVFNPIERD
jgi:hypothetical protein